MDRQGSDESLLSIRKAKSSMTSEPTPPTDDLEQLNQQQLEIYAKELQRTFQEERRLSDQLKERNQELEQRVNELTALNRMFQEHLSERYTVIETYKKLVNGLRRLVQEASDLEEFARSQPIPDLEGIVEDGPPHESGDSSA